MNRLLFLSLNLLLYLAIRKKRYLFEHIFILAYFKDNFSYYFTLYRSYIHILIRLNEVTLF